VTSPHDETPGADGPFETGAERPPQGPDARVPEEGRSPVSKGPEEGRRPGGDPEVHPDAEGFFGEETEAEPDDQAASDELLLAQTALAERTLDLQRLQAEFLNYKRRVDRDRELIQQNATFSVLSGLLPVLDDIDRAREHGEVEGGFKAVADSLERIVTSLGLTKFGAKGDEFDPNVHEALMHGHSPDVTTTTVDVVAHAGYRIGDRVVRAAKVTVLDPES